jgi:uncharacterized lipoprotein YddW (UPF0748 family)
MKPITLPFSIAILLLQFCLFISDVSAQSTSPRYEFRAVWIATVDNIDWPSKKGLSSDEQKKEFIQQLDLHKANGMNAVIMQIRPAADAFYPSPYEPWSEWLTGIQGKPPYPYYDPLEFMISEVHKRGMEFHAWCNPYRAVYSLASSSISPTHITKLKPDWFINYGGKKYFDPGNKEVQSYVNMVVEDILKRYDIDALHFDDYFYPYRVPGKVFLDSATYLKYGNGMALDDWRRSNVDSIILSLSRTTKRIKPYCRFGISPFGVWRNQSADPDGSATKAGQTNYDDLYANILLWLKNGWIDYVAPQLYWEFGHSAAAYETLLEWWSRHTYGKDCYIGLGIYKAGTSKNWRDVTLIPRQIQALRETPNIGGAIYFSSKSFMNNPLGWNDSLRNNYYRYPALIPPYADNGIQNPPVPLITDVVITNNSAVKFKVSKPAGYEESIRAINVYLSDGKEPFFENARLIKSRPFEDNALLAVDLPKTGSVSLFVTYQNRVNHESSSAVEMLKPISVIKLDNGSWVVSAE